MNFTSNVMWWDEPKEHSITEMSDFFTSFTPFVPQAHSAGSFNSIFPLSPLSEQQKSVKHQYIDRKARGKQHVSSQK